MRPGEQGSRWSWRGASRAASVAATCLLSGAAIGYAITHERAPFVASPPRRSPGDEAVHALVAPLREGSALEGYAVERIDAVHDGVFSVLCTRGDGSVRLDVALGSPGAPPAPAAAGRYAVYYAVHDATAADGERLARALASVLVGNASIAAPQGLSPFSPSGTR